MIETKNAKLYGVLAALCTASIIGIIVLENRIIPARLLNSVIYFAVGWAFCEESFDKREKFGWAMFMAIMPWVTLAAFLYCMVKHYKDYMFLPEIEGRQPNRKEKLETKIYCINWICCFVLAVWAFNISMVKSNYRDINIEKSVFNEHIKIYHILAIIGALNLLKIYIKRRGGGA